jgi:arsenate reductase-like glutaredoxin family protein
MGSGVSFYGRKGDPDTLSAQRFLQQNRYGADKVLDLDAAPPDWAALRKALGGSLWPVVDARHPTYGELLPRGAEGVGEEDLERLLDAHRGLVKAPILLTPKGALAGFREQKWRAFLDIGKETRG